MKDLTLEWVEKADGDWDTALRELRARKRPNFDAACFHSQQVAEKYLKAYLQEIGITIPYSHNLIDLAVLCSQIDQTFLLLQNDVKNLEGYAVRFRYPGVKADRFEAKKAVKTAGLIRKFLKSKLNIP